MATVANAYVQILPSAQGIQSAIANALTPSAESAGKSAGVSLADATQSGFIAKAAAISSVVNDVMGKGISAITDGIQAGISRLDTLSQFNNMMVALGESSEDAEAAVDAIKSQLDGLPTSTADIASFVQQIKATGVGLTDATDYALAFNNAMLAGGKGQADVNNAMLAYQKIMASGTVYQRDWLTLVNTSPAAMNQLAEAILGAGASQVDLREALQDGTVSLDEFNAAMVQLNKEGGEGLATFEEQARAATGGIQTAIDLIGSRIGQQWYKIFDAIGQTNISGAINAFTKQFNKFGDIAVKGIESIKATVSSLNLGDTLANAWAGAAEAYTPILEALGTAVEDLGRRLALVFTGIGAALGEFVSGVGARLPELLGTITMLLDRVVGYVGAELIGQLNVLTALIDPIIAGISLVLDILTALEGVLEEVTSAFFAGFVEGLEAIDFTNVTDALYNLGYVLMEVFAAVSPILQELSYMLGEALGVAIGIGVDVISQFASVVSTYLMPVVWEVTNWLSDNVYPVIESLITYIETNVIPAVTEFGAGFIDWLLPALESVWAYIQDNIMPIFQGMAAFILEYIVPAIGELVGLISENFVPVLSELFSWIDEHIIPVFSALSDLIFGTLAPALGDLINWFADTGVVGVALEGFMAGLSDQFMAFTTVITVVIDSIAALIDWINAGIQGWLDLLSYVGNGIGNFFFGAPSFDYGYGGAFAAGGYVSTPTALVGEGRSGEFVWPDDTAYLGKYADALVASMDKQSTGTSGGVSITGNTFNVRKESDIRSLAMAIDTEISRSQRSRW